MTNDSSPVPEWINQLRRDFEALRKEFSLQKDHLSELTVGDFTHIFDAASRFEDMLGTTKLSSNNHDLMNVLTALRGYTEMLREDIGASHNSLDGILASLLESVQAAYEGDSVHSADHGRDIQS
ncbi:MAG: hypothetical protein P8L39_07545, partial [Halioglobus sp.]|nr:hypothetical protein [Halioglobus sp.]